MIELLDDFLPAQDVLRVDEKPWQRLGLPWMPCDRCGVLVEPWPSWPVRLCERCHVAVQDDSGWAPARFAEGGGSLLPGGCQVERLRWEKLQEIRAYWLQRGDARAVARITSWLARCGPSP